MRRNNLEGIKDLAYNFWHHQRFCSPELISLEYKSFVMADIVIRIP